MNIICKLLGHKLPCYNSKGWYSPGEQYGTMEGGYTDGINRIHVDLYSKCERCGNRFHVMKSHVNNTAIKTSYEVMKRKKIDANPDP